VRITRAVGRKPLETRAHKGYSGFILRFTQSLLLVGLLSLGASACSDRESATSTTGSTTGSDSGLVAELESELATAQQDVASAREDVEARARTVAQLQADLDRAREQARASAAEAAAATGTLNNLASLFEKASSELCPPAAPALPADLASELVRWLSDTQGSVPDGTEATLTGGVTAQGWWLFTAEFNMRFQPAIFVRSPSEEFIVAWSGLGGSEIEVRAWVYDSSPSMPAKLALCADVGTIFLDRP